MLHVEKNLFDNIFFILLDSKDKRIKDDIKSRNDLALYCSCNELQLISKGGKSVHVNNYLQLVRSDVKLMFF